MDVFTTVVKPAPSWVGQVVDLGPIDQIAPRCYMTSVFCLRLAPNVTKASIIKRLNRMIFAAVQENPQLATTVVPVDNSREELELRWLEDSGATLTYKDYTSEHLKHEWKHGSFDDLAKANFPYDMLSRRTIIAGVASDEPNKPAVTFRMQANLIQGGMVLVNEVHHSVCDGIGAYWVCNSLAKHCRNDRELDLKPLPIDFADRATAVTPNLHASLKDMPDWQLVAPNEEFLNPTHYDPAKLPALHCATYFISKERINQLRDAIAEHSTQKPNANEAISSLLWQHIVSARNIDPKQYPEAKLSLTVDARGRMAEPPVSRFFWGNFCEPNAVARMPTTDFSSKDFLSTATKRVRSAIENVNASAVQCLTGLVAQLPKATAITWNVDRWPGPDMLIVCLQSIPLGTLDFGPDFGVNCEAYRLQIGDIEGKPDGRCIIFPPFRKDGGGLEVMLQYEKTTIQNLDMDRSFTRWFERRS